ncbi:hypothetical protein CONLIGDRAFT_276386 [Coniochaeta ligniaria NRRL 30616]|uniref:Uncharacterized protein n=1 Tax=Coniochaeta ligniaria NRRL 30616 TaxID=1408157 RepID=A0A1J7IY58_9PEZI|nr:hypothetical protein CONLIGDRAFT_276386 [Coniochaeta ligniaria NRRL 30616]
MDFDMAAQPFGAIPQMQNSETIDDLLGLCKGKKPIPQDLMVKVLGTMPLSAALRGLGLMQDSHLLAAELQGYIKGYINAVGLQEKHTDDPTFSADAETRIRKSIMDFIKQNVQEEHSTKCSSRSWRLLAVGVLIDMVRRRVNLASNLRPQRDDEPYLELNAHELDMLCEAQQVPQNQVWLGNGVPSMDLGGGFGEGYQSPTGPFQQERGPYMAGGLSGFDMSLSPQPNLAASPRPGSFQFPEASSSSPAPTATARSPGHHSLYSATPRFGSPLGSPLSQHASFPNQGSGHISAPNTPQSPAGSFLIPHSIHLVPSPVSQVARTLSPLSNNMSNLHMSPSPDYRQSLSPTPSEHVSPWPLPSSPTQSIQQDISMTGSPLSPMSNFSFGTNLNNDGYNQAGQYQHEGADAYQPVSSLDAALLGPTPNIDVAAPVHQSPYHGLGSPYGGVALCPPSVEVPGARGLNDGAREGSDANAAYLLPDGFFVRDTLAGPQEILDIGGAIKRVPMKR